MKNVPIALERLTWLVAIGAYIPLVVFVLSETRAPVIVRRKAAKLRKERGMADGGRYTARSEIGRLKFLAAMSTSLLRPLRQSLLFFISDVNADSRQSSCVWSLSLRSFLSGYLWL